ncbi:hypothetical protein B0H13DRAFT_2262936 [Mycena leptocephala]|nr:hypothetical protein B0H13DRAFT_2262936 [Mycena leptocephala]
MAPSTMNGQYGACRRDNLGNGNVCSIAEIDADDRQVDETPVAAMQHQLRPATRQDNTTMRFAPGMKKMPALGSTEKLPVWKGRGFSDLKFFISRSALRTTFCSSERDSVLTESAVDKGRGCISTSLIWMRASSQRVLSNWSPPSLPSHSLPHHSRNAECAFIQATILSLTPYSITLSRAVPELGVGGDGVLCFDYAVYALGSRLPEPLDLWDCTSASSSASTPSSDGNANAIDGKPAILHALYGGTKPEGIAWLKRKQRVIEEAASVLVVGGGALGIQFASDIASAVAAVWGWGEGEGEESGSMHEEILQALHALNVHVVLGERVDSASLSSLSPATSVDDRTTEQRTVRTVKTTTGREIGADLVLLCTGQTPNTALLRALDPRVVDPVSGLVRVGRGMQLAIPSPPSNIRGTTPNGRGATTPPTNRGGAGAGAGIRRKKGAEEEAAPAHADTTHYGDVQTDKDDEASLLAAALAEIELLDAASGSSSSDGVASDLDLDADSLALDSSSAASASRSLANERDKQAAEPCPSFSASAPSASPSRSLASEHDKEEAEPVAFEETAVLAGETDEAPSLDEGEEQTTPYPHIFAIGDAADAFGALPAGHNAWAQGEVAGRNVLRLISRYGGNGIAGEGCEGKKRDEELELETYTPGPPAIKVSLGLHKTIYQVNGTVGVTVGKEREDLNAAVMWAVFGRPIRAGEEDGEEIHRVHRPHRPHGVRCLSRDPRGAERREVGCAARGENPRDVEVHCEERKMTRCCSALRMPTSSRAIAIGMFRIPTTSTTSRSTTGHQRKICASVTESQFERFVIHPINRNNTALANPRQQQGRTARMSFLIERLDERREAIGELGRTESLRDLEKRARKNVSTTARTSETLGLSSIGVFASLV